MERDLGIPEGSQEVVAPSHHRPLRSSRNADHSYRGFRPRAVHLHHFLGPTHGPAPEQATPPGGYLFLTVAVALRILQNRNQEESQGTALNGVECQYRHSGSCSRARNGGSSPLTPRATLPSLTPPPKSC